MSQEQNTDKKATAEIFADMFKKFGQAMGEIFDDPELKEKAREFAESAAESAKAFGNRFKDEDVKDKFKDVGKAAEDFGKSVADHFKKDKEKISKIEEGLQKQAKKTKVVQKLLDKTKLSLSDKQSQLNQVQEDLDKIQSAKVYKLWQKYNDLKKRLFEKIT